MPIDEMMASGARIDADYVIALWDRVAAFLRNGAGGYLPDLNRDGRASREEFNRAFGTNIKNGPLPVVLRQMYDALVERGHMEPGL